MTAPTKNWTDVLDATIASGQPVTQDLLTAIRDDLKHLQEWLGYGYTAAQAHNHDGVNSALMQIGPNWVRNGSFESSLSNWTSTLYTGGTIATNSSNEGEGATGLAITSTVAANGGGYALSDEYMPVPESMTRLFMVEIKASAANVPLKATVVWYTDAKAQISTTDIISTTTASPTSTRLVVRRLTAPSTAKWARIKLELPTAGGAAGTVYFDAVTMGVPAMLGGEQVFTADGTFSSVWGDVLVELVGGGGGGRSATSAANGGAGGTTSFGSLMSATGGAGGTNGTTAGGTGTGGTMNIPGGYGSNASASGSVGGASVFSNESGDAGLAYGGGGRGQIGGASAATGGGGGGYAGGFVTTTGDVTVTIGTAGTSGGTGAFAGAAGVCRVRW